MLTLRRIRPTSTRTTRLIPSLRSSHPFRTLSTSSSQLSSNAPSTSIAIIGAGLGGLSSAIYLLRTLTPRAKQGTKIVIYEKENRVGGWCRAIRLVKGKEITEEKSLIGVEDKLVFETGPRSIRPVGLQGWLTIEMAHFLKLTPHLLTVSKSAPSAKNRYLFTPPTLTLLPSSLSSLFKDLLSPRSLMRRVLPQALLEPFRPRSKLHTSLTHGDESIDSFFTRRFGKPLSEEMISGMIHGIYAGDSRRLSVRAVFPQLWEAEREWGSVVLSGLFGRFARRWGWKEKSKWRENVEGEDKEVERIKSELRGLGREGEELVESMNKASVWGVEGGLQEITIRMKEWLEREGVEFRLGEPEGGVEEIERTNHLWRIRTRSESSEFTHLITTIPSLLPTSFSTPKFPSTTVSVINLSFPSASSTQLFPPGFGYLIPRTVPLSSNPHQVLGVLFDSDVMPSVDSSSLQNLTKCSILLGGSYWLDKQPPSPPPSHERLINSALETLKLHFPHTSFPPPTHAFSSTHLNCIPQVPPKSRSEILAFSKSLLNDEKGGGKVGIVGGGFASVGVNGAVKAAWEVGRGFAGEINELHSSEGGRGRETEKGERRAKRGVRKAVRTGMEMWEV